MASAILKGDIRLVAESPEGKQNPDFKYRTNSVIAAGGSPDGVLANTTRDKWAFIPLGQSILTGGWKVKLQLKMDTADGSDASDCVIQIPLTIRNGGIKVLDGANDLGYTVDLPAATSANWVDLGTGYTIPNGQVCKIGGDYGVISIQDDA